LLSDPAQPKNYFAAEERSKNNDNHQNGYGKIVAVSSVPSTGDVATTVRTHLTELRHSSPMRLVPSRRTHPVRTTQNAWEDEASNPNYHREGALVHLSSYGGGLVPGDNLHLDVDVRGKGAMLAVMTQGGQRIYRPGENCRRFEDYKYEFNGTDCSARIKTNARMDCKSTIQCTIGPGATLLYLPDPTVPYRSSSFEERRVFNCQYASTSDSNKNIQGSLIAVDWYSSGRTYSTEIEERWAFDFLATRTELYITDQSKTHTHEHLLRPYLIESMSFGNRGFSYRSPTAATAMGKCFNAMATMLLLGPTTTPVARRSMELERKLAGSLTRIRRDSSDSEEQGTGDIDGLTNLINSLGGQVLFSVTPVDYGNAKQDQQLHMVRILASNNEDIYRIFHWCLKECSVHFGGLEPYKERIHSSQTVQQKNIPLVTQQQTERRRRQGQDLQSIVDQLGLSPVQSNNDAWFRLCTLSDGKKVFISVGCLDYFFFCLSHTYYLLHYRNFQHPSQ
jgi:urease accessory protein UreH